MGSSGAGIQGQGQDGDDVGRSCRQCGQEMSDLARFCSNCGAPLVDLSAEAEVQSTGNLDVPVSSTGPLGAVGTGSVGSVAVGTAMLIVRRGPSEGTSFVLDSDLVTVGRSDDADVVEDDVGRVRPWVQPRGSGSTMGTCPRRVLRSRKARHAPGLAKRSERRRWSASGSTSTAATCHGGRQTGLRGEFWSAR